MRSHTDIHEYYESLRHFCSDLSCLVYSYYLLRPIESALPPYCTVQCNTSQTWATFMCLSLCPSVLFPFCQSVFVYEPHSLHPPIPNMIIEWTVFCDSDVILTPNTSAYKTLTLIDLAIEVTKAKNHCMRQLFTICKLTSLFNILLFLINWFAINLNWDLIYWISLTCFDSNQTALKSILRNVRLSFRALY